MTTFVRCETHGVVLQPLISNGYKIYRCPYCGWEFIEEDSTKDDKSKEENKNVAYD